MSIGIFICILFEHCFFLNTFVKLKCFNVNRPLFGVHSDLMCHWSLHNSWVIFCFFVLFWESGSFWEGSKTHIFLLPGVTKAKKPKPLYLIEFSLGEFVISIIASPLKFVQSLLFAFYTASASPPCSYCKTVSLYFVDVCPQLCLVWSVVFILWYRACSIWISDGIFWFITSIESLNRHHVTSTCLLSCRYLVRVQL